METGQIFWLIPSISIPWWNHHILNHLYNTLASKLRDLCLHCHVVPQGCSDIWGIHSLCYFQSKLSFLNSIWNTSSLLTSLYHYTCYVFSVFPASTLLFFLCISTVLSCFLRNASCILQQVISVILLFGFFYVLETYYKQQIE